MVKCEFYNKEGCKFNKDGICTKYKSKSDNLSLHCSGEWTKEKVAHFKWYADIFSLGMKNKWPSRFYIDLFCGPGKSIIREGLEEINGTVLDVLDIREKFTKYFFVDMNKICIESLKKRVGERSDIEFYSSDCNLIIEKIIDSLPSYSLSLAVIDPDSLQFNFKNYGILSRKKVDLIINYPIAPIERAISSVASSNYESRVLDNFHPGWRNIINKNTWGNGKKEKMRKLREDYFQKIRDLGYYSCNIMSPVKNGRNATLYYLIFFSKDKKGIEFWEKQIKSFDEKNRQPKLI